MKDISEKISKTDENLVESFLNSFDLKIERYSSQQQNKFGKTPDFKVLTKDDKFILCEVKSILPHDMDKGILHKKVLSIITDKISDANKKFISVNSQHFVPNILVFVTHNPFIDWKNYIEVLQGKITIPNSWEIQKDTILLKSFESHDAHNRLKNNFSIIDLTIWLYGNEREPKYILTSEDKTIIDKISKIFRIKRHLRLN